MPFMFGYHPAFLLNPSLDSYILIKNKKISIKNVLDAGAGAFPILNCNQLVLIHPQQKSIEITTQGFNNFMLWTEVKNMLCIEPITQYPLIHQKYTDENMNICDKWNSFQVVIRLID